MQLYNNDFLFIFPQLGMGELSIIVLLVLILFGPGKLPGVMKALGDGVRQFKDGTNTAPAQDVRKVSEQTAPSTSGSKTE